MYSNKVSTYGPITKVKMYGSDVITVYLDTEDWSMNMRTGHGPFSYAWHIEKDNSFVDFIGRRATTDYIADKLFSYRSDDTQLRVDKAKTELRVRLAVWFRRSGLDPKDYQCTYRDALDVINSIEEVEDIWNLRLPSFYREYPDVFFEINSSYFEPSHKYRHVCMVIDRLKAVL